MYSYDPLQGVPEDLQHLVIGGETHIWSEQTDTVNLDKMVRDRPFFKSKPLANDVLGLATCLCRR